MIERDILNVAVLLMKVDHKYNTQLLWIYIVIIFEQSVCVDHRILCVNCTNFIAMDIFFMNAIPPMNKLK